MSGEVKLVKAVDGGAEPRGSWKMSLGETVCADPPDMTDGLLLTEVKADEYMSWNMALP